MIVLCWAGLKSKTKHILRKKQILHSKKMSTYQQKTSNRSEIFSSTSFNISINFQLKLGNEFLGECLSNHFSWVSRGCHVVFVIPPVALTAELKRSSQWLFRSWHVCGFFQEKNGTCQGGKNGVFFVFQVGYCLLQKWWLWVGRQLGRP